MYTATHNEHLKKFKDFHKNQSAILFATGPTIEKYQPFDGSQDCIKIGINSICDNQDLLFGLDYYFFGSGYYKEPRKSRVDNIPSDIIKFGACYEHGSPTGRGNIHPDDCLKIGAIPFENNLTYFSNEISKYAMLGHSIVFPAIQFTLYTGVSTVYLVGCDCGFSEGPVTSGDPELLHWWSTFKEFKEKYYSDVKIISINPVSLKGYFEDAFI